MPFSKLYCGLSILITVYCGHDLIMNHKKFIKIKYRRRSGVPWLFETNKYVCSSPLNCTFFEEFITFWVILGEFDSFEITIDLSASIFLTFKRLTS